MRTIHYSLITINYNDSRLALVLSRQLDSKPFGDTNCRPKTGSELPSGNATVGESPSAKGCPPEKEGCSPQR
ncbi:MAG: hypothetical protein LBI18_12165 [Planctomycetaceae bacterium]|nr:hypothetical protein [Planctomycetaceae bacterium]